MTLFDNQIDLAVFFLSCRAYPILFDIVLIGMLLRRAYEELRVDGCQGEPFQSSRLMNILVRDQILYFIA